MKFIYLIAELDYSDCPEGEFVNICACNTLETAREMCKEDGFTQTSTVGITEVWSLWKYDDDDEDDVEITRTIKSITYIES